MVLIGQCGQADMIAAQQRAVCSARQQCAPVRKRAAVARSMLGSLAAALTVGHTRLCVLVAAWGLSTVPSSSTLRRAALPRPNPQPAGSATMRLLGRSSPTWPGASCSDPARSYILPRCGLWPRLGCQDGPARLFWVVLYLTTHRAKQAALGVDFWRDPNEGDTHPMATRRTFGSTEPIRVKLYRGTRADLLLWCIFAYTAVNTQPFADISGTASH